MAMTEPKLVTVLTGPADIALSLTPVAELLGQTPIEVGGTGPPRRHFWRRASNYVGGCVLLQRPGEARGPVPLGLFACAPRFTSDLTEKPAHSRDELVSNRAQTAR